MRNCSSLILQRKAFQEFQPRAGSFPTLSASVSPGNSRGMRLIVLNILAKTETKKPQSDYMERGGRNRDSKLHIYMAKRKIAFVMENSRLVRILV